MVRRSLITLTIGFLVLIGVSGCGDADPSYEVTSTMVSHETTADVWVWAPDGDGSWPVVYALPGSGGDARRDMAVLATGLASRGVVVFVTDYGSLASVADAARFTECGYRFSLDFADQYGGDLSQPVAMDGYSLGVTTGDVVPGRVV